MMIILLLQAFYATIAAYGLSHLFGALSLPISIASLLFGAWLGWRHGKSLVELNSDWKFLRFGQGDAGLMELVLSTFVLYAAFRHFAWMLFPMDNRWMTLSATNFGDLPLHINYIRALANGIAFPPRDAIYASELLRYPFGPDLYNALWEQVGVHLQAHILVVGLVTTVVSLILLRSYASWWGIGAFFLSGGLAGWEVLSGVSIRDFQSAIDWKNLFLAMFITQRGMLFALPIGLILLISYRRSLAGEIHLEKRHETILGLLWGFLPLFHLHAFVIVSLLMASMKIEFINWTSARSRLGEIRRELGRSAWAFLRSRMALVAYLPAIYFVLRSASDVVEKRLSGVVTQHSVVRWSWGWLAHEGQLGRFLVANFGPWLFVPILLALSLAFSRDIFDQPTRRRLWIELAGYCFWFLLFFNLMLAPWEWDNIKLLVWPYLGFARLLWVVLEPRMGSAIGFIERPLVAMTLFLSGFVAISWTLQSPPGRAVSIYSVGELANADGALSGVPVNAVFAAAPSHNHVLSYFGRLRAVGYAGHLWSHGLDASAAQDRLDHLMKGDANFVELAHELGVTHIFWGPEERAQYGQAQPTWATLLPNISRVPDYAIYAVH